MTKPSQIHKPYRWKQTVVLLAGASSIALTAGCSSFKNPFSSQRPDQVVTGERRLPLLNQRGMMKAQAATASPQVIAAPPPAAPAPAMVPAPAAARTDAYDYYSAASSEAPAATPGRSLGTLNPAPVKAETVMPRVRKPLPGNVQHEILAAPAPKVAPSNVAAAPSAAFDASTAEPVMEKAAAPPAKEPSFFERIFGSSKPAASEDESLPPWKAREERAEDEEMQKEPYPSLSSVPPKPEQFEHVKAARDADMQDLQAEHARAAQEKAALSSEPSQQPQNVSPVEMPAPTPEQFMPDQKAPKMSAPPPQEDASGAPHPRRGIDIMTQEEWDAMQRARQQDMMQQQSQPVPPESQNATPQNSQQGAPAAMQSQAPADAGQMAPAGQNATPSPNADNASQAAPSSQDATPATDGQDGAPSWWDRWGGKSASPPEDAQKPAEEPQSALPAEEKPVASADVKPAAEAKNEIMRTEEDASPKRPSFFSRLFSQSPKQAESDRADAAAATADAATVPAPSDKETPAHETPAHETVVADQRPEWVKDWLNRPHAEPPAAEKQADTSVQTLTTTPMQETVTLAAPAKEEQAVASRAAEPAAADAKLTEKAGSQKDESGSMWPADWLQSLVSDASANEHKDGGELKAEAEAAAALPVPTAAPGEEPQLIGQMSDKTMLKLVDQAPATKTSEGKSEAAETPLSQPPVLPTPVDTASEAPAAKEAATAAIADTKPVAEPEQKTSFLGRLFGSSDTQEPESDSQSAENAKQPASGEVSGARQAAFATTLPTSSGQTEQVETVSEAPPVIEGKAPLEAVSQASGPEAAKADEADAAPEKKPSFFSRLFTSSPKQEEEKAEATPEPASAKAQAADQAPAPAAPAVADSAEKPVVESDRPSFFSSLFSKKGEDDAAPAAALTPASALPASGTTPLVAAAAAPVTQVTTGAEEPKKNTDAANAPSALPSPQILKEIKMMPASRYSARRTPQPSAD